MQCQTKASDHCVYLLQRYGKPLVGKRLPYLQEHWEKQENRSKQFVNGFNIFDYVHVPGMSVQRFPHYIREQEKEKRKRELTINQAKHRSRQIIAISRTAMEAGDWGKVIVILDKATGTLRGRLTKKKGIPQHGSRKYRYGNRPYMPDAEWIQTIMDNEDCDEKEGARIFNRGKVDGWLTLHCGLWGGCFAEKVGTNRRPLTDKQQENWDLYATMPPVRHNYRFLQESDQLKWIIQFWKDRGRIIGVEEAEQIRVAVWNCVKHTKKEKGKEKLEYRESRLPWKKENGFVVGKRWTPADQDSEEDLEEGWTPEASALMLKEKALEDARQAAAHSDEPESMLVSDTNITDESEDSESCDDELDGESDDEPQQRDGEYTARRLGTTVSEVVRRREEDERRAAANTESDQERFLRMRAMLG
jgi:hypothetical protein